MRRERIFPARLSLAGLQVQRYPVADRRKAPPPENLAGKRGVSFRLQPVHADTGRSGARISAACCLLSLLALRISERSRDDRRQATGLTLPVPHHRLLQSDDRANHFQLMKQRNLLGCDGSSACQRGESDRHRGRAAFYQSAASGGGDASFLIRWASSVASRRSLSSGILSSAFFPAQPFRRQDASVLPRHV